MCWKIKLGIFNKAVNASKEELLSLMCDHKELLRWFTKHDFGFSIRNCNWPGYAITIEVQDNHIFLSEKSLKRLELLFSDLVSDIKGYSGYNFVIKCTPNRYVRNSDYCQSDYDDYNCFSIDTDSTKFIAYNFKLIVESTYSFLSENGIGRYQLPRYLKGIVKKACSNECCDDYSEWNSYRYEYESYVLDIRKIYLRFKSRGLSKKQILRKMNYIVDRVCYSKKRCL